MKKVIDLINVQDKEEGPHLRWVRADQEKQETDKEKKIKKPKTEKQEEKRTESEKIEKSISIKKKPFLFSFSVILLIVAAVFAISAAGLLWLTFNPKLFLTLRIKQESLDLREEVELNVSQPALDAAKRIVPAQFLEDTQEKSQVFKATGVSFEDEKAQGVIKVYNNSNPPSFLTLRQGTRFLSSGGGKIFKAQEKIILPAPIKQGSKIIPNVKEVQVVAQEVGAEYNIGPSKFSVPGLVGTSFYYVVWGESEQSMAGGSRKEVSKISSADKENAKNELYKTLKDLTLTTIREKSPAGYTVDDRAVLENDFIFSCDEPLSTTTTADIKDKDLNFTCLGKLSLKALIFRLDDFKTLALGLFNERKPANREIVSESLYVSLAPKGVVTQSGRLVVSLISGAKTYNALNQNVFLNSIVGKNKEQIEQIAADESLFIEDVDFKFWPFWVKKAPSSTDRIEFRLTF